jgi:hypothetical protein
MSGPTRSQQIGLAIVLVLLAILALLRAVS